MESVLGASLGAFVGFTVILAGGAAFLMGQAIANTWRPAWQCIAYGVLLAVVDRFLLFALFGAELLSLTGYLASAAILVGLALVAYRATRARKMAMQYPWLIERTGPFSWRERH